MQRHLNEPSEAQPALRWQIDDIPFGEIGRERIADRDFYFHLLVSASFVEITAELYTRNLVEYFAGDVALQRWLLEHWSPEEMQHGHALRRYVGEVWPEFDWESAYRGFYADYEKFCKTELLGPTRGLEMASRCIVETGTSSLYAMLHRAAPEPVLRDLAQRIRTDEAYHYQHFHAAFLRYRAQEATPRRAVLRTLLGRVREIGSEDAYYAFKHAFLARHPGKSFNARAYRDFNREARQLARRHYPYRMAVHMGLKPLMLPEPARRLAEPAVRIAAKHLLS
ncbi:hypothetical protein BJI67_04145 [Acidihalobacter aeolianus]|uniref:Ferritin n=1 Tax=Acidihalobacter aeolianus TaxID=2792603 RepID=A0A1D8K5X4_9GAMM|nr:ferritin-like domain-containing protein [Acidihalobacter aeolianus]AOV16367.1 hypothetical protein BJI67_04145 [Acidihalobacter aeolianus]